MSDGSKEVLVARGLDPEPSKTADMNFLRVVRQGDEESVGAYLAVGVGPNVADDATGASALELAVELGHTAIAVQLLDAGANASAVNRHEESALHIASRLGRVELVEVLCQRGAPLDAVSARGFSALALAIHHGQPSVATALLAAGANIDESAESGKNALSVALSAGRTSLADMLLDAGADPNHRMGDDERPLLMQIAVNGPPEMISLLISRGAEVDAENAFGVTSYQAASAAGREEVALTLRVHGASSTGEDEQQLLRDVASKRVGKVAAALVRGVSARARDHHGMNALMHAAKVGSTPILAALIDADVELEAKDALGRTALVHACLENQVRAAKRLLKAGASTGEAGQPTPLTTAAFETNAELVRLLVSGGADVNAPNHLGNTALALAAHHDEAAMADLLLDHGADPSVPNNLGHTPLIRATLRGHVAMVHRLIAAGADPNFLSARGESALGIACGSGDSKVVAALLAGGADPSRAAEGGVTPLTRARQAGQARAAEMIATHMTEHVLHVLTRSGLSGAALFQAIHDTLPPEGLCEWVRLGRLDVVSALIKAGASVESVGCEGERPLHVSVMQSNLEMVELLLGHGAEVDSLDTHGRTPLMRAAHLGAEAIVAMLIDAGANVQRRDQYGTYALHAAASAGRVAALELLVGHGADVNCSLAYPTPLLRAIQNGQRDAALWLIAAGAGVEPRDANGDDALMWAVEQGLSDVVGALLRAGANPDRPNNANITARTRAQRRGEDLAHDSMVDALRPLPRTTTDRGHIDALLEAPVLTDAARSTTEPISASELIAEEEEEEHETTSPGIPLEGSDTARRSVEELAAEHAELAGSDTAVGVIDVVPDRRSGAGSGAERRTRGDGAAGAETKSIDSAPEQTDEHAVDEDPGPLTDLKEAERDETDRVEPPAEEPLVLPRPDVDFVPSLRARRKTVVDSDPFGQQQEARPAREDDTTPFHIERDPPPPPSDPLPEPAAAIAQEPNIGVIEISAPPSGVSQLPEPRVEIDEAEAARAAIGVIEIEPTDSVITDALVEEDDHELALFGASDEGLFGREDTYVGHADPQSRLTRDVERPRMRGESTLVGSAAPMGAASRGSGVREAETPGRAETFSTREEPRREVAFSGVSYSEEADPDALPVRKVRKARASFAPPRGEGRTSVRSNASVSPEPAVPVSERVNAPPPDTDGEELELDVDVDVEIALDSDVPPSDAGGEAPKEGLATLWLIAIRIGSIDEVLHALSEHLSPMMARQIVERTLGGAPQLVVDEEPESFIARLHSELERAGGIAKIRRRS